MSNHNSSKKPLALAIGSAFAATLAAAPMANAAENPFAMNQLSGGYMQVADSHMEGKCGGMKKEETAEGKCGGMKEEKAEGKCGEGKCGGAKAAAKTEEGKCGGMKKEAAAEGKCGGMKKEEKAEGKCGEGKCGGMKSGE